MNPLLFPFTCDAAGDAGLVLGCFGSVSILTLSSAAEIAREPSPPRDGLVRIPLDDEHHRSVMASVSEYRRWADIHRNTRGALKALVRETPWFTSDTSIASLRARIEQGARQTGGAAAGGNDRIRKDIVRDALVFLRLAQELDRENQAIDRSLDALERNRAGLFADLAGDGDPLTRLGNVLPKTDPGELMTSSRLRAWSILRGMVEKSLGEPSERLYVTTSPAVQGFLEDVSEKSTKMLDIDSVKVHLGENEIRAPWRSELLDRVRTAAMGVGPTIRDLPESSGGGEGVPVGITVFLFSGEEVDRMFSCPETGDGSSLAGRLSGEPVPVCLVQRK
jgi:hypothetical protein